MMKLVRENIQFKRGMEPSKSLDIGSIAQNRDIATFEKNLVDSSDSIISAAYMGPNISGGNHKLPEGSQDYRLATKTRIFSEVPEIIKWIKENTGREVLDWHYGSGTDYNPSSEWGGHQYAFVLLPENIKIKKTFFGRKKFIKENIQFKRGMEPSKALDIGRSKDIEKLKMLQRRYKTKKENAIQQYLDWVDVPSYVKDNLREISQKIKELKWSLDPEAEERKQAKAYQRRKNINLTQDKKLRLINKTLEKEYPEIKIAIKIFDSWKWDRKKATKFLEASTFNNITAVRDYILDARVRGKQLKKEFKVTGHLKY